MADKANHRTTGRSHVRLIDDTDELPTCQHALNGVGYQRDCPQCQRALNAYWLEVERTTHYHQ